MIQYFHFENLKTLIVCIYVKLNEYVDRQITSNQPQELVPPSKQVRMLNFILLHHYMTESFSSDHQTPPATRRLLYESASSAGSGLP